jgi:hypothetical protein
MSDLYESCWVSISHSKHHSQRRKSHSTLIYGAHLLFSASAHIPFEQLKLARAHSAFYTFNACAEEKERIPLTGDTGESDFNSAANKDGGYRVCAAATLISTRRIRRLCVWAVVHADETALRYHLSYPAHT